MNKLAIKLFKSDQKLPKLKSDNVSNSVHLQPTFEQSHTIIIITRESYSDHIKQIMKDTHYSSKLSRSRKAQQPMHIYWKIFWDRVVANKAHFEVTPTSETIQLFKNKPKAQKWFLTNISFEWSFAQITGWIEILKTSDWTEQQKYSLWSEKEAHCAKLPLCTVFSLCQMRKMHDCIVAEKETDQNIKNQHIRLLTDVLKTLWLKQSATQFLFFDNFLTQVIVNTHYVINCSLFTRYNELVNSLLMIITDQLKKEHAVAKINWVNNSHIDSELSINVNNWMMKMQQLKVLSSFSQLKELDNIKSLVFSNIEDWERNWVHMKKKQLYELEECNFFYKKHIVNICLENNCTKIKAINDRIKEWDKDEKTVFCFMSSMNALILYWVCSTLLFTLKLQPQQL